jgi:hypothetical protein
LGKELRFVATMTPITFKESKMAIATSAIETHLRFDDPKLRGQSKTRPGWIDVTSVGLSRNGAYTRPTRKPNQLMILCGEDPAVSQLLSQPSGLNLGVAFVDHRHNDQRLQLRMTDVTLVESQKHEDLFRVTFRFDDITAD